MLITISSPRFQMDFLCGNYESQDIRLILNIERLQKIRNLIIIIEKTAT